MSHDAQGLIANTQNGVAVKAGSDKGNFDHGRSPASGNDRRHLSE
jgi:hypothetical protein